MSFTASPIVSPFPDQNALFDPAKAIETGQTIQQNQLHMQGQQMDLTTADHEQVGRLAAGLLNEPDLGKRAQYYAQGVGMLQSQGLAKYAPPTMPDDGTLRMLATQAIPAAEQYKLNLTKAGADAIWPSGPAPTTGAAAQPTTGGAGTQGQVPPLATAYGQGGPNNTQVPQDWLPYFQEASQRTGIPADVLIAQMRQESGFNPALTGTSGEIGPAQVMPSTARAPGAGVAPVDPSMLRDPRTAINFQADYLKARLPAGASPSDPVALNRALYGYNGGGDKDYVAHVTRYLPAPGGGTATATAQPAAAPAGAVGTPPPYQTASTAPTAPPAPTPAPGAPAQPPATAAAPAQPGQPPAAQAAPAPTTATPGRATPPPAPTVTIPPRVPLPAAPAPTYQSGQYQGLTPDDVIAINRVAQAARVGTVPATAIQTEIDSRRNKNISLAQTYQAAQEKQRADDIATAQLQLQAGDIGLKTWQAANPDAKITQVGGEIITQDPHSGQEIAPRIPVNANREDLAAALTVARLGPRIAAADAGTGPPVSPEDRAAYAVQANAYQQFKEVTDPISKQVKSVPTRPLPPNFPGTAAPLPLTQGLSPSQQEIERDPAAFEVNKRNYNDDATDIRALSTSGRQLQSDQVRVKQMQDVLQGFTSGPGTEARTAAAAWFQRWLPSGLTGWEKEPPTLSGAAAAQEFQKLALGSAGQQDQALLGKNAGYRSLELFRNANPNSELLDPTNAHILDMQLVQNQASQDYIQAAQAHFRQNEQAFKTTHQYNSLNDFDADWGAQRNPQVYAAAMGAIAGQPASKWSDGLSVPEYTRALQVVQRAKPSAIVQGRNGPLSMQPNAPNQPSPNAKPMPPGFAVVPQ